MRKILIVEDEKRIADLIRSLIHWEELGAECCGICYDGMSAWEMTVKERPDIVITDIRMPVLGGLDLIKKIIDADLDVKFIVMSGFQEFDYAYTAMKYGVEQYLVKPVDEDELNAALLKVLEGMNRAEEQEKEHDDLMKKAMQNDRILKETLLRDVMEDRAAAESLASEIRGTRFLGIDIKLDAEDLKHRNENSDRMVSEYVSNAAKEKLGGIFEEILVYEGGSLNVFCLCCGEDSVTEAMYGEALNGLLSSCKDYLRTLDQYRITIGIGRLRDSAEDIRGTLDEAYLSVCSRVIYGTGRLIWRNSVVISDNSEWIRSTEGYKALILKAADSLLADEMPERVRGIFEGENVREGLDMTLYFKTAEDLVTAFYERFDTDPSERKSAVAGITDSIHHCFRKITLSELISHNFTDYINAAREKYEMQSAKPVRQAMKYVEEHYRDKILLDQVAEKVGLNPVYFSTLFKKETGDNFSTYLINFRMEKAKELLATTSKSVSAIAEECGYPEQKYFSQQFKKVVGVKPVVYRQLHS